MTRIPEDEWEEIAEGIPAKTEPFLQKYLQGRDALIAQEKKQRSGELGLSTFTSTEANFS